MLNKIKTITTLVFVTLSIVLSSSCFSTIPTRGQIDGNAPIIASVTPSEFSIGDTVIIKGKGFDTNRVKNIVQVSGNKLQVLESNPNTLKVEIPILRIVDDIKPVLYITVGKEKSNEYEISYIPKTVVETFVISDAYSICADSSFNIYTVSNGGRSIKRTSPMSVSEIFFSGDFDGIDGDLTKETLPPKIGMIYKDNAILIVSGGSMKLIKKKNIEILHSNISPPNPMGIAEQEDGFYLADPYGQTLSFIDKKSGISSEIISTATGHPTQLNEPSKVVIHKGYIYIANKHFIVKTSVNTPEKYEIYAGLTRSISDPTGTPLKLEEDATKVPFGFISGMDIDKEGNLYVADSKYRIVRKISNKGKVTTIAGRSSSELEEAEESYIKFNNGIAERAIFSDDMGDVLYDANNKELYVADHGNLQIRKVILK